MTNGVHLLVASEVWLQPWEGDTELMAQDYSPFRKDRAAEKVGEGTLIQVVEN